MTELFSAKWFPERHSKGVSVVGRYMEPVEAIEAAEAFLQAYGEAHKSHAEVRFNGDREPHYLLFHLGPGRTGLFNTDACRWPVFNIEGTASRRDQLAEIPWDISDSERKVESEGAKEKRDVEKAEKRKTDEDAKTLRLDAERDEGDKEDSEDADSPEYQDSEEPEGDDGTADADEDSPDTGGSEDRDDGEGGGDEPMRLKFYAKMRGPKGWRKRADSDPEREVNSFTWRVGTVEDDREGKYIARAVFRETDDERTTAKLTVNYPEWATVVEKNGRIEITIPTQE